MVPARQKRYIDRVENLPQLMTRIYAELGDEITYSKRKFKKGGFLGIGGVWMYEIIARSTADFTSQMQNYTSKSEFTYQDEQDSDSLAELDEQEPHFTPVIDSNDEFLNDLDYSTDPEVLETRLQSSLPPEDNYTGDVSSWPAAQRAIKRKVATPNHQTATAQPEPVYEPEDITKDVPAINIISGRDIQLEEIEPSDNTAPSFVNVLKSINEIEPAQNELMNQQKESTFEEETQAAGLKVRFQESKPSADTEADFNRISPLKTRVTKKVEPPESSKSKSVWPFNPDLELPEVEAAESSKPKVIKVGEPLKESIRQIQEAAKGDAAKAVAPPLEVVQAEAADSAHTISAEEVARAINTQPSFEAIQTAIEGEKVDEKLADIMRFLKDIQRQVNSISESKPNSTPPVTDTPAIMHRPEFTGAIVSDPVQQAAINEVMEWDISPSDATELVQRAMSTGSDSNLTLDLLLKKVKRVIYGDIIITEGIKAPETSTGKVVVFIGSTGVGKTTTIAKIAAGFLLGGKHRVALVSIDTYRIAAAEQLKTYAEIMGLSLDVVFNKSEFDQVLTERRRDHLVLVDTAGRSPLNREQMDQLRDFLASHPPDEIHLVVDAATKRSDIRAYLERFNRIGFDAIILSKLDETGSLGAVFNISQMTRKPISYFTFGQSVPQDISPATLSFIRGWVETGDKR